MTGGGRVRLRQFRPSDAEQVRALFVEGMDAEDPTNTLPRHRAHTRRCLDEDLSDIGANYTDANGGVFWVAVQCMREGGGQREDQHSASAAQPTNSLLRRALQHQDEEAAEAEKAAGAAEALGENKDPASGAGGGSKEARTDESGGSGVCGRGSGSGWVERVVGIVAVRRNAPPSALPSVLPGDSDNATDDGGDRTGCAHAADSGELLRLQVAPSVRTLGIGRRLVRLVVDYAASRGWSAVTLGTITLHAKAMKLYVSEGFEEQKRTQYGELTVVNYRKELRG